MATTHYAIIDSNMVGPVFGIGSTAAAAMADARRNPRVEVTESLEAVPCTAAAAAYVETHGGAPSPALTVTSRGVCLRSEEE